MRSTALATFVFAAVLALVTPAAAATGCIKPQRVEFASGPAPSGGRWILDAGIRRNGGSCREWLFSFNYYLPGASVGGSSTGIPAGGHTDPYFNISGFDYPIEGREEGVVGGYVGQKVATVKLTMSDGTSLELHPQLPPGDLRRKHVWMRGFRYFLSYYPGDGYVSAFRLFDRAGTLLYRKLNAEGELW